MSTAVTSGTESGQSPLAATPATGTTPTPSRNTAPVAPKPDVPAVSPVVPASAPDAPTPPVVAKPAAVVSLNTPVDTGRTPSADELQAAALGEKKSAAAEAAPTTDELRATAAAERKPLAAAAEPSSPAVAFSKITATGMGAAAADPNYISNGRKAALTDAQVEAMRASVLSGKSVNRNSAIAIEKGAQAGVNMVMGGDSALRDRNFAVNPLTDKEVKTLAAQVMKTSDMQDQLSVVTKGDLVSHKGKATIAAGLAVGAVAGTAALLLGGALKVVLAAVKPVLKVVTLGRYKGDDAALHESVRPGKMGKTMFGLGAGAVAATLIPAGLIAGWASNKVRGAGSGQNRARREAIAQAVEHGIRNAAAARAEGYTGHSDKKGFIKDAPRTSSPAPVADGSGPAAAVSPAGSNKEADTVAVTPAGTVAQPALSTPAAPAPAPDSGAAAAATAASSPVTPADPAPQAPSVLAVVSGSARDQLSEAAAKLAEHHKLGEEAALKLLAQRDARNRANATGQAAVTPDEARKGGAISISEAAARKALADASEKPTVLPTPGGGGTEAGRA